MPTQVAAPIALSDLRLLQDAVIGVQELRTQTQSQRDSLNNEAVSLAATAGEERGTRMLGLLLKEAEKFTKHTGVPRRFRSAQAFSELVETLNGSTYRSGPEVLPANPQAHTRVELPADVRKAWLAGFTRVYTPAIQTHTQAAAQALADGDKSVEAFRGLAEAIQSQTSALVVPEPRQGEYSLVGRLAKLRDADLRLEELSSGEPAARLMSTKLAERNQALLDLREKLAPALQQEFQDVLTDEELDAIYCARVAGDITSTEFALGRPLNEVSDEELKMSPVLIDVLAIDAKDNAVREHAIDLALSLDSGPQVGL